MSKAPRANSKERLLTPRSKRSLVFGEIVDRMDGLDKLDWGWFWRTFNNHPVTSPFAPPALCLEPMQSHRGTLSSF